MKKILARKGKKQFIEHLNREVLVSKQRLYFVDDISKDLHVSEGLIPKAGLKKKDGTVLKTNQGKEFTVFSAGFIDNYRRIKRLPQVIPLKDIGLIVAETGVGRTSTVVDAGGGSGAVALFFAHLVKNVVTYEIKEDCAAIIKENMISLGLKNVKVKNKDICRGIDEKDTDLVVLDLPSPWNALGSAGKSLKPGGFLVSYSPTIVQAADFVNAINSNDNFMHLKTVEVIERPWEIDNRKVRPKSRDIIHSGFLSFTRKIR